mmetsp:Transcript_4849/g.19413  ORF Transcript_4849/g.19413 Transcript_4849/m.19413 type:complete len:412 (+) Transcript_4849:1284-2519(+)|eukprot:scaffold15_cov234-Pinguiococcus_pyrenoidosus.AAC.7
MQAKCRLEHFLLGILRFAWLPLRPATRSRSGFRGAAALPFRRLVFPSPRRVLRDGERSAFLRSLLFPDSCQDVRRRHGRKDGVLRGKLRSRRFILRHQLDEHRRVLALVLLQDLGDLVELGRVVDDVEALERSSRRLGRDIRIRKGHGQEVRRRPLLIHASGALDALDLVGRLRLAARCRVEYGLGATHHGRSRGEAVPKSMPLVALIQVATHGRHGCDSSCLVPCRTCNPGFRRLVALVCRRRLRFVALGLCSLRGIPNLAVEQRQRQAEAAAVPLEIPIELWLFLPQRVAVQGALALVDDEMLNRVPDDVRSQVWHLHGPHGRRQALIVQGWRILRYACKLRFEGVRDDYLGILGGLLRREVWRGASNLGTERSVQLAVIVLRGRIGAVQVQDTCTEVHLGALRPLCGL